MDRKRIPIAFLCCAITLSLCGCGKTKAPAKPPLPAPTLAAATPSPTPTPRATPTLPPGEQICADFRYRLNEDDNAVILGYRGKEEDVVIPEALDGYSVTAIGEKAFYDKDWIVSIEVPDSVVSIFQEQG